MSKSEKDFERAKPWEILPVIIAYIAAIKEVPSGIRSLGLTFLLPNFLKAKLLQLNASSDFWIRLFFTIIIILIWSWMVWRVKRPFKREEKKADRVQELYRLFKRDRLRRRVISIVKTFGLVLLRESILDRMKVDLYDTFNRPSNWPPSDRCFDSIDRIHCEGRSFEFQYLKNFSSISVSETLPNSDKFNEPNIHEPSVKEIKLLLIASNFFPFWYLLYLMKRLKRFFR